VGIELGTQNVNGLSDLLAGDVSVETAIQKSVGVENFDFIPRGQVPPNPAELLMHKRLEDLLDWANDNYDLVVVDTPPILAVTDPAVVGKYVGTALLVARFDETAQKELQLAKAKFEQSGVPIKGAILNGVVKQAGNSYGYYHYDYGSKRA